MAVSAVPEELTTTISLALPVNVGILSKPAAIASSSARMLADVAAEPVVGKLPWL